MSVIWTPEAEQDRADVWDYIAADNPLAAARNVALIYGPWMSFSAMQRLGWPSIPS